MIEINGYYAPETKKNIFYASCCSFASFIQSLREILELNFRRQVFPFDQLTAWPGN